MKKTVLFLLFFLLSRHFAESQNNGYTFIIDSANVYPSIDQILELKELKNKVVYVDVWGTHCSPCLREFQEVPSLKQRFQNEPVAFLYLCSPYTIERDPKNEKLWKDLILKNQLKGIHVMITSKCYVQGFFEKYRDKYSEERRFGIPTYLLVDKTGHIRDFDAPRPSKGLPLYEAIQKLINEK